MKAWHVYILSCNDGTLYTGITNDLPRRVTEHNEGTASKYTRVKLPVKLIYSERKVSRSAALKREAEIKSLPRSEKIRLCRAIPGAA